MSASRCEIVFALILGGCLPVDEVEPPPDPEPAGPPAGLELYTTGDDADADVDPQGPLLLVMGGSAEVDDAFRDALQRLGEPGDVVVIRTSGSDGYNDYLYDDIGGVDSVQTMLLTSRDVADDPWVAWRLRHAEVVWMAGGDQWTYVSGWHGTAAGAAIRDAWGRGALVGGTSAGAAVLGELIFTAERGGVSSAEVLADPYDRVALERDLDTSLAPAVAFDTHFAQRDRMGRLVGFVGRSWVDGAPVVGVGLDERTAVLFDGALGVVSGGGAAHVVEAAGGPERCEPGSPLMYSGVTATAVRAGGTIDLAAREFDGVETSLSVDSGVLLPPDPYGD